MKPYFYPSLVRRRRRRILLPCFANAKPLPEAGNNNYLGSECDHLPEAGNIYIYGYPSIHPYLHLFIVGAAEGVYYSGGHPVGPSRPSIITHPEAAPATVTCSYII